MPRKSIKQYKQLTSYQLSAAANDASQYLRKVSAGNVDRPSASRIDVCKFIINHTLGTPRQKVEHIESNNNKTLEQFTTEELRKLLIVSDKNINVIESSDDLNTKGTETLKRTHARPGGESSENIVEIVAEMSSKNQGRGTTSGIEANYLDNVANNIGKLIDESARNIE